MMFWTLLFLAAVAVQVQLTTARVAVSMVVRIADIAYYMYPDPEPALRISLSSGIEPVTVFRVAHPQDLTPEFLRTEVERFRSTDDVWSASFLTTIVIIHGDGYLSDEQRSQLDDFAEATFATSRIHYLAKSVPSSFHEGPFLLFNGSLHPAYRLYPDTMGAFVVGTVPSGQSFRYQAIDAVTYGEEYPSAPSIPVPSRLYFKKSREQPHAGSRIAIADTIDLAGLKSGTCSPAEPQLYPPQYTNAHMVQKLLDQGYVVVGKVKMNHFGNLQSPTYAVADRYQSIGGSSAGGAAAVAAYGWLDFAVGTDILGGIRAPAAAQGIFGMRPSLEGSKYTGIIPSKLHLDTISAFARDASSLSHISKTLYSTPSTPKCSQTPSKLLYPTELWAILPANTQKIFDRYILKLESHLHIPKTPINLSALWDHTKPVERTQSLEDYFESVLHWLTIQRSLVPSPLPEFQSWFDNNVLPPADNGCADTLLLTPWSTRGPEYRERERKGEQRTGRGFFWGNIAPFAGVPEMVVPVGYSGFLEEGTGREERLPVGLGVLAGRGGDVGLSGLIAEVGDGVVGTEAVERHGQVVLGG